MAVLLVRLADETAAFIPFGTLEAFRSDLGLSYSQAGMVLAAIWPGGLAGSAFSAMADRHSRRAIAAGGAFAFALSLVGFAAGQSFPVLLLSAAVLGAGSTAMVDATEVALVEMAGEDLRRYLARSNLLGVAGDVLGPGLVAGMAVAGLSWRLAFWVAAGLMALYGLVLMRSPLPPPASADEDGADGRRGLGAVLRDPAVWVVGLILLLLGPFDEPLIGFVVALLEEDRGASRAVATSIALVGMGGGALSYTVLARRFESVDHAPLLLGSVVAMTAAAMAMAFGPGLAVVAAGAFLASVGLNLAWLAVQHRSLTLRPGQVGTTNAVLGAIEVAGFWVPAAIGAVADRAGLTAAVGSYGLFGAALIALAWASARGRRRAGQWRAGEGPGSAAGGNREEGLG